MTTYTITAEQLQQLLACVKAMYDYAGCRVHMQSYADQSADSLALLRKLQPNTQEPAFWLNELGQLSATRGFAERNSPGSKLIPHYTHPAHGVKP